MSNSLTVRRTDLLSRPSKLAAGAERGAVLFLIVLVLTISVAAAGVAVDISLKESRAQDLQNAADAAALAGAQTWANGDVAAATARVYEILAQNGVSAEFVDNIDFPTASTVQVNVRDETSRGLLSPFTGGLSGVSRSATASHVSCQIGCDQTVEAPPILRAIEAVGFGDGFLPIAVGDRLYSVNHHSNSIACVDKITQEQCWPWRPAFADNGVITGDNTHPVLIGTRIYFVGNNEYNDYDWWGPPTKNVENSDLVVGCFETITDQACLDSETITGEGFGLMTGVGDRLFVFTGSRKVYCLNPDFTTCGGYIGGLNTQASGLEGWDLDKVSILKSDLKVVDGKIYYTMADDGAVWVQCWNTNINAACSNFGPILFPQTGDSWWDFGNNYKTMLARSTTGVPEGFCIMGFDRVRCYRLDDGRRLRSAQSDLNSLRRFMRNNSWNTAWSGVSSYHAPTNQVYVTDSYRSRTYCFSYTDRSLCGSSFDSGALGPIGTYGYIEDSPDCLIGLGHNAIFFSMKPDLSGPCDSSGGFVDITPCVCQNTPVWPRIAAGETAGVLEYNVRVEDPDGNEVVGWTDLLVTGIDLEGAPEADYLRAFFNVIVDPGADPWGEGTPPTFRIIGREVAPHLVD